MSGCLGFHLCCSLGGCSRRGYIRQVAGNLPAIDRCAQAYLQRLEQEIQLVACHLDPKQRVEQLHFGGGTPTFLSHDELRQVMGCLRQHFNLLDDDSGDYGIEIDPREADWATMGLLRELGFNRVSIGLQDLDPEVQRAVNRLQSLEETRAVIDAARTNGVNWTEARPRLKELNYSSSLPCPSTSGSSW